MPGFPIGPRSEVSPALLSDISQQYGLGSGIAIRDLGGAYNLNLLIDTAQSRYVARVFRPWVTAERLLAIQQVKSQLARAGLPVILPLPTLNWQTFIRHASRLVELEPFLPHVEAKNTWSHYQEAFRFLGQLHQALATRVDPSTLPPPLVENYALPDEMVEMIAKTRQRIEQSPCSDAPQALEVCAAAQAALHLVSDRWQKFGAELPRQLVHGDYGLGNVLFDQGRIIAVLDFDFLAVHERLFDLAYALFFMLERVEPDFFRIHEMLAAYEQGIEAPLLPVERSLLLPEMARVPPYWIGEASFLPDPIRAVLSHAGQVVFATQLLGL